MKLRFILFLFITIQFFSCNKNNDNPTIDDNHKMLYDKWWYGSKDQGRGDHFFGSDGSALWTLMPSEGSWEWRPNDSLKVVFPSNPPIVFWFTKIENDNMEYWPSTEPEGILFQFSTTEP